MLFCQHAVMKCEKEEWSCKKRNANCILRFPNHAICKKLEAEEKDKEVVQEP